MFKPKVFWSKFTVLNEVLATLLGLFGAPSDSVPGVLCSLFPPSLRPLESLAAEHDQCFPTL